MNIYEKINAIMGEVKSLQKDGRIAFGNTKYNYLSEAKTTETFRDPFVKYKLVLLPINAVEFKDGQITQHIHIQAYKRRKSEEWLTLCRAVGHDTADKGAEKRQATHIIPLGARSQYPM